MSMSLHNPRHLTAVLDPINTEHTTVFEGIEVWSHFAVELTHPDWTTPMLLHVTVDPERGPIASGLSSVSRGPKSTATDVPTFRELGERLRSTVDVNDVLRRMTAEAVGDHYRHRAGEKWLEEADDDLLQRTDLWKQAQIIRSESVPITASAYGKTKSRRRRIVSNEHLAEVASVYRDAMSDGLPPTKSVAEHFHASHSTAARWVAMARTQGALGRATGPRPGEDTP